MGYSGHYDAERMARAYGKELKISPKASNEICRRIRGMVVEDAIELLEDVVLLKKSIPYKRYNKRVAHRKEGAGGRFPVKASQQILKVIRGAVANATYREELGHPEEDELRISTAAAYKGRILPGWIPRAHGRATPFNEETTNVEIIVELMED